MQRGVRHVGTPGSGADPIPGDQIGEEQIDLECSEAFRFDLQVTKTPID